MRARESVVLKIEKNKPAHIRENRWSVAHTELGLCQGVVLPLLMRLARDAHVPRSAVPGRTTPTHVLKDKVKLVKHQRPDALGGARGETEI